MSFLKNKMSQNDWATILPFGPVTLIFYWPKKKFSGQPQASPHFRHCIHLHKFVYSIMIPHTISLILLLFQFLRRRC